MEEILTYDQIRKKNKDGEFFAIGENGREYHAVYTTEHGGVMFFCIPADVEIIGYRKK